MCDSVWMFYHAQNKFENTLENELYGHKTEFELLDSYSWILLSAFNVNWFVLICKQSLFLHFKWTILWLERILTIFHILGTFTVDMMNSNNELEWDLVNISNFNNTSNLNEIGSCNMMWDTKV